ncbi:methyltransferase domain-containing protein [Aurantimonas sp. Leaf443]|uniref:methyltransferase domain-containing protein n=1 Tax=Aurantimonas sp. Leaf443 TaxID=1736378 RepID=UPI0006F457D2|nr:methyltransferase domain-containing protein [Aurantimonas sp. Leaf443]KQT86022.1 3-demethylubiquinone-9 3-methyltransferase [Aurantimonas sp. Leaf443]
MAGIEDEGGAEAAGFDEDALSIAYARALAAEKAGRPDEAAEAYRECLAIDPDDHCGAQLRLAAIGQGEVPASAGDAYVATLFDQHADDFETILVDQLHYGVPDLLAEKLAALGLGPFSRVLDLGCGTGLAGEALREAVTGTLIGVDLSEGMIETAFDKEVYDHLYIGEAVGFLEEFEEDEPFDLMVAADMLPYLGALDPLLAGVTARLVPGGLFAFSSETLPEAEFAGAGFKVGRAHRFHHALPYVTERLATHGFERLSADEIVVRLQENEPAPGHLVVARRR